MDILRQFRETNSSTPVLILSARGQIEDKVEGLDLGANDYLTKPFHFEELEARIRSLTRRRFIQENVCLKCGRISFDTRTRKAHIDSEELSLTRKESALLEYFMLHQNRIISPEELIEHIWDGSVNSFSNSIRVHIFFPSQEAARSSGKRSDTEQGWTGLHSHGGSEMKKEHTTKKSSEKNSLCSGG